MSTKLTRDQIADLRDIAARAAKRVQHICFPQRRDDCVHGCRPLAGHRTIGRNVYFLRLVQIDAGDRLQDLIRQGDQDGQSVLRRIPISAHALTIGDQRP